MKFLVRWGRILWKPLLIGLAFGLLISNLTISSKLDHQTEARLAAVEQILERINQRTEEVIENSNQHSEEIQRVERLTACLVVDHDINLPVPPELREQCRKDIMNEFAHSPTPSGENQNNAIQNGANGGTPPTSSNGEGEPQSILPMVDEPIIGCIGRLCL